ncbi:MAG: hypothetical protein KAJ11_16000, partial [Alphaproteobacteria bacterium]|nr:hypothetical protein [Alphaproteobacteria bacterium]
MPAIAATAIACAARANKFLMIFPPSLDVVIVGKPIVINLGLWFRQCQALLFELMALLRTKEKPIG